MWDGVTYVDPSHDPIIHEGFRAASVIVANAGPAAIALRAWQTHKPKSDDPDIEVQLWPGNTKSISGNLIRARSLEAPYIVKPGSTTDPPRFAAIGWRFVC